MQLQPLCSVPNFIRPIAGWLYDQWGRHLPNRSIDTAESALKQPPNSEGLPYTLIAVAEEQPVGVARMVESDLDSRTDLQPWLASVFVPPHKRNQGIGRYLCSGIVKYARVRGFQTIYLFTPDKCAFYEKQGWAVMGFEHHRGIEVTLMKFELSEF